MKGEGTQTIRITQSTHDTLKELSARTQIDMSELLDAIFRNVQLMLDLQEANRKLLFMADWDPENRHMVHIRLSDAMQFGSLGSLDLPKQFKRELQKQTDKENRELKGEKQ